MNRQPGIKSKYEQIPQDNMFLSRPGTFSGLAIRYKEKLFTDKL